MLLRPVKARFSDYNSHTALCKCSYFGDPVPSGVVQNVVSTDEHVISNKHTDPSWVQSHLIYTSGVTAMDFESFEVYAGIPVLVPAGTLMDMGCDRRAYKP